MNYTEARQKVLDVLDMACDEWLTFDEIALRAKLPGSIVNLAVIRLSESGRIEVAFNEERKRVYSSQCIKCLEGV